MKKPNNTVDISGILLLNKPLGLTSNAVLQKVKRLYTAKKAGHTGSLDPLATGMLPICLGEATKVSQYLLEADKCYEVTGLLGIKTTTGDAAGDVLAETKYIKVTDTQLQSTLEKFIGETQQIPSMYSALKYQGKPLYEYARAGKEINRAARAITVHSLQLKKFDGRSFELIVECSKGTYIRNLVEDIGDSLGVGAYVTRLHRRFTAGFSDEKMHTLEDLADLAPNTLQSLLLPIDRAVAHLPPIMLNESAIERLYHGQVLPHITEKKEATFRIYDERQNFIGLGYNDSNFQFKVLRLLQRPNC